MINNDINVTFDRNMYNTPITIEFRQKWDQDCIIPVKFHCDIYAEILLIDPIKKMINNDRKVFTHPKKLQVGKEYAQSFTAATENKTKFNTVKVYVCFKIESTTKQKKFLYNNDGGINTLLSLKKNNMGMK